MPYFDRFDIAQAYYWWLVNHHKGQFSREYERLSKLSRSYRPGACENGPEPNSNTQEIYDELCRKSGSCDCLS